MLTKVFRESFWIAKCQYRRFFNIKNIFLMVCSVIFLGESVIHNMVKLSRETGLLLNSLEPSIMIMAEEYYAMVIPLTCLVLLSEFPDHSSSGIFMMIRVERRSWFLGQLLYAIGVYVSYMVILVIGSILWLGRCGNFSLEWSPFMLELIEKFPDLYQWNREVVIPPNTFTQGLPLTVFFISIGLMLLYVITFVQILCICKLLNRKKVGIVFSIAATILGALLTSATPKYKWLIPMSHAIFGIHFNGFFAEPECRIVWSLLYFLIFNGILLAINLYLIKKCQIGDERE